MFKKFFPKIPLCGTIVPFLPILRGKEYFFGIFCPFFLTIVLQSDIQLNNVLFTNLTHPIRACLLEAQMTFTRDMEFAQSKERNYVSALARGLEVLSCFKPGDSFLGNNQIAERTGLPKSTISRLTFTLTEIGYLQFSPDLNKYRLGTAVLSLSYALLAQMDVRRVARPLMQALAEHTQAAVNLGVRDRLNMVYIDTYRNASTYAVQLDVGSQIPIATTSMGRAYISAMPETERNELLEQIRLNDEANWPRIKAGIDQAMKDYQEKGYCLSLGDWRPEVHAIAVPLVANNSAEILVFSCSGASFQLRQKVLEEDIGPRLLNLVGNTRTAMSRP
jgi:DNA-binding IclR family transcriptional regulator